MTRGLVAALVVSLLYAGTASAKGDAYVGGATFTAVTGDSLVRFFNATAIGASGMTTNAALMKPVYNITIQNTSTSLATVRLYGAFGPLWDGDAIDWTLNAQVADDCAQVFINASSTLTMENLVYPVLGLWIVTWSAGGNLSCLGWNTNP